MEVDPVLDDDKLPGSADQEMVEQQEIVELVQEGMSQEEQEAHDLETKGYCITSWKQVCRAGEIAQARRERAERKQQQKESILTWHNRNKERVIQKKSCEIQDLCARIKDLKRENQEEIQRIAQEKQREIEKKNLEIQSQYLKIAGLYAALKEMRREHRAELESYEQMQALLLADLREWCQVNDEEVDALKEIIDRQGKRAPATTSAVPSLAADHTCQHSRPLTPTSTTKSICPRSSIVVPPMLAPSSPQPSPPSAKPSPTLSLLDTQTL